MKKELETKSAATDSIELRPESEWENEGEGATEPAPAPAPDLSDRAISYLAQIQDLQEQLEQEKLKVERLEMAIRGFTMALQEEIKGL
jgi:hypothetical protein